MPPWQDGFMGPKLTPSQGFGEHAVGETARVGRAVIGAAREGERRRRRSGRNIVVGLELVDVEVE